MRGHGCALESLVAHREPILIFRMRDPDISNDSWLHVAILQGLGTSLLVREEPCVMAPLCHDLGHLGLGAINPGQRSDQWVDLLTMLLELSFGHAVADHDDAPVWVPHLLVAELKQIIVHTFHVLKVLIALPLALVFGRLCWSFSSARTPDFCKILFT